jgi:hypothetical protein
MLPAKTEEDMRHWWATTSLGLRISLLITLGVTSLLHLWMALWVEVLLLGALVWYRRDVLPFLRLRPFAGVFLLLSLILVTSAGLLVGEEEGRLYVNTCLFLRWRLDLYCPCWCESARHIRKN